MKVQVAAESGGARASAKTSATTSAKTSATTSATTPQVKKIPSAPAVVAGAVARLFTSASGIVARAGIHARQGPAAIAPPERYPGPAQMYMP